MKRVAAGGSLPLADRFTSGAPARVWMALAAGPGHSFAPSVTRRADSAAAWQIPSKQRARTRTTRMQENSAVLVLCAAASRVMCFADWPTWTRADSHTSGAAEYVKRGRARKIAVREWQQTYRGRKATWGSDFRTAGDAAVPRLRCPPLRRRNSDPKKCSPGTGSIQACLASGAGASSGPHRPHQALDAWPEVLDAKAARKAPCVGRGGEFGDRTK